MLKYTLIVIIWFLAALYFCLFGALGVTVFAVLNLIFLASVPFTSDSNW